MKRGDLLHHRGVDRQPARGVDDQHVEDLALCLQQRRARDQVRAKEAQLAGTPEGTLTRDDPRVAPKIKKGYEPIPVEE